MLKVLLRTNVYIYIYKGCKALSKSSQVASKFSNCCERAKVIVGREREFSLFFYNRRKSKRSATLNFKSKTRKALYTS